MTLTEDQPAVEAAPKYTAEQSAFIEEQREWIKSHRKANRHLTGPDMAKRIGIALGTISQFWGTGYKGGDEVRLMEAVARYRDTLMMQAQIDIEAPTVPDFYETPTTAKFMAAYRWGQRGRIVAIAAGPGTSKSSAAVRYRDEGSSVWVVFLAPSSAGVNNMQIATLEAMGESDVRGTPQALSRRICERLTNSNGLLIYDEAQHLSVKAIEEIRSWWDKTRIGIVLQGNVKLIETLEGGNRRADFAQLFSRISLPIVQALPDLRDAEILCEAWQISDPRQIAFIGSISQKPGGLRTVTNMIELAMMRATGKGRALDLQDLHDAWTQIASRPVSS